MQLLTFKEAQNKLEVPYDRMYKFTQFYYFPTIRIGHKVLVNEEELDKWVEATPGYRTLEYKKIGSSYILPIYYKVENNNNSKLLSSKEIQRKLKLGKTTFYKLANLRCSPIIKIGSRYYVSEYELSLWINQLTGSKIIL